jgi:hypothetical protein
MSKPLILFVTDENFLPFAIRSINSFSEFHSEFRIFLGLVGVRKDLRDQVFDVVKTRSNSLEILETESLKGVGSREWSATRRAAFCLEIFEKNPNSLGVLYFDVDYLFYDEVAESIVDSQIDFMLRSSIHVSQSRATSEQISSCLEKLGGEIIETPVWSNGNGSRIDINSGLIWIKNTLENIEILKEWEILMRSQNYAWFSDQNMLRNILQKKLEEGKISWRPVDRALYSRFLHEKGERKILNLENLRNSYFNK